MMKIIGHIIGVLLGLYTIGVAIGVFCAVLFGPRHKYAYMFSAIFTPPKNAKRDPPFIRILEGGFGLLWLYIGFRVIFFCAHGLWALLFY